MGEAFIRTIAQGGSRRCGSRAAPLLMWGVWVVLWGRKGGRGRRAASQTKVCGGTAQVLAQAHPVLLSQQRVPRSEKVTQVGAHPLEAQALALAQRPAHMYIGNDRQ